jgi:hypothetical protein
MTFLVVYPIECLLELVGVVRRTLWKKIKFSMLCALKQICGQFHDMSEFQEYFISVGCISCKTVSEDGRVTMGKKADRKQCGMC